jgi:hypothetical protein
MEINVEKMSVSDLRDLIKAANNVLRSTKEDREIKARAAIHKLFVELAELNVSMRTGYYNDVIEETEINLTFDEDYDD